MLTAKIVAEYIINQNASDDSDLTNLKLQKLLYYCQGFHLAIKEVPLFNGSIEHWEHGPVVPAMYHEYKKYGKTPLSPSADMDFDSIPNDSREIIDEVLKVYGQFSALKLRDMTHNESPWRNTEDCEEITHQSLTDYFKTRIQ